MILAAYHKKHLSVWLLFPLLCLFGFLSTNSGSSNFNEPVFRYVYYEYGLSLQKKEGDFGIRSIYEVYSNKEMRIVDRLYKTYKTYSHISLPDTFYQKLLALKHLSAYKVQDKLEEGVFFAGAYEYLAINHDDNKEAICFITPFISDSLNQLIRSLYRMRNDSAIQQEMKELPDEVKQYKKLIIRLHNTSHLPLIQLPPPGSF